MTARISSYPAPINVGYPIVPYILSSYDPCMVVCWRGEGAEDLRPFVGAVALEFCWKNEETINIYYKANHVSLRWERLDVQGTHYSPPAGIVKIFIGGT